MTTDKDKAHEASTGTRVDTAKKEDVGGTPDNVTEDGGVRDRAAQLFLEKQKRLASTAPMDRVAEDASIGTPQWYEDHSPEGYISDGGSTLHRSGEEATDDLLNDDEKVSQKKESHSTSRTQAKKADTDSK